MTWASKLLSGYRNQIWKYDLVLAVLEKNKEIIDKLILKSSIDWINIGERDRQQARAFRELVKECQLLKPTNNCQISSKKEVQGE